LFGYCGDIDVVNRLTGSV